ncbi:papain-like cysteine protease family protein [Myceligenerans indicum]|uniref:papain-like cysteine protease family protein n=1 Tax=Myceligenerans indicum TaxID=2593663 RepID=UPI001FD036C5|nr:papain-like cysteine protease family protein [Myceligenerans indicum]
MPTRRAAHSTIRTLLLSLALTLTIVGGTVTVAEAANRSLAATIYVQEKSNWCWAATSKTVVKRTTGNTPSQCTLVKRGKNSSTCPNVTGTFGQNVSYALADSGVSNIGTVSLGALTYSAFRGEIDSSRLVMIRWGWSSGGGHMLVLKGYNTDGSKIIYINPLNDVYKVNSYSWMKSTSSHTWSHSRTSIF